MDLTASPFKDKNTASFFKLFRRSSTNGSKKTNHTHLIYGTLRRSKDKSHCPILKQESGSLDLIDSQLEKHKEITQNLLRLIQSEEWSEENQTQLIQKLQSAVNEETSVVCFLLRRIPQTVSKRIPLYIGLTFSDCSKDLDASCTRLVSALHKVLAWSDDIKFKRRLPDQSTSRTLIDNLDECLKKYCQAVRLRESAIDSVTDRKSNISIHSADGGLECTGSASDISGGHSGGGGTHTGPEKRHALPPLKSFYDTAAGRVHLQELFAKDDQITPPPKPPLPVEGAVLALSPYCGISSSTPPPTRPSILGGDRIFRPHSASDPFCDNPKTAASLVLPLRTNCVTIERDTSHQHSLVPSGDPNELLDKADMEQELAQVASKMQDVVSVSGMSSVDGVLSELAGKEVCGDCFKTEVESDTEEMEEIIEHEGKKYRRRIKKRIVRTRQIQREIVTGPTPPMITSGSPPSSLGCDVFSSIEDSGTGGITDDDSSPTEPPPEKPPLPGCLVAPRGSRATTLLEPSDGNMSPVQGYMFWFGQAAGPVSPREVDSDVVQDSKQLFDYFRSIWHHSELEASPHERSKSISYTQHYGQQTTSGAVVHRTTTVSQTRKIKLKTAHSSSFETSSPESETKGKRSPSPTQEDSPSIEPEVRIRQDDPGYVTSSDIGSSRASMHHILEETDAHSYLLMGEVRKEDMRVTGGCIDALIVYATTPASKDFIFHETFLAFYRKFLSSEELIERLIYRYNHFRCAPDLPPTIRRESYYHTVTSFLIHVVTQLQLDFTEPLLCRLREFHERLLKDGEYQLAELLHRNIHHQWDLKLDLEKSQAEIFKPLSAESITTKSFKSPGVRFSLLQFSARAIAEQMTLIDLEYFRPIHIEEMLKFAENEVLANCPNLMRFITNTNNTNLWVLTQILSKERKNLSERLKYLQRFLEISKILQTLQNYNAYITVSLALNDHKLKGLRSQISKVQRKQIEDLPNLLQCCERDQKMSNPVIPHLGKTLQYLIHTEAGNSDELKPRDNCPGPIINMWKCWKIYTILSIFAKKKKEENAVCGFDLKRNEEVLSFLNNYRDILDSNTLSILADEINGKK